jgi:hypothetical protein
VTLVTPDAFRRVRFEMRNLKRESEAWIAENIDRRDRQRPGPLGESRTCQSQVPNGGWPMRAGS